MLGILMTWKLELIIDATLICQMATIFYAWRADWLVQNETTIAVAVFIIGIVGGLATWLFRNLPIDENKGGLITVRIVGAVLTALGVVFVFVPFLTIILHSGLAASFIIAGIVIPVLCYKNPASKRKLNA